jgi:hypothetical protein
VEIGQEADDGVENFGIVGDSLEWGFATGWERLTLARLTEWEYIAYHVNLCPQ